MSIPKPREFTQRFRCVNGIYLFFWDKDSIYAQDKNQTICFHKWFMRRKMFYSTNWRPFMRYCTENNSITMEKLMEAARRNEIEIAYVKDLPIKKLQEEYVSHKERRKWHDY